MDQSETWPGPFVVNVKDGDWHHSTFPEPLITLDHDVCGAILRVVAVGEAARALSRAIERAMGAR